MCPVRRSLQWSALTVRRRVHLEPSRTRTKAQAAFTKPVSKNSCMEHFVLSPSCELRLLGTKGGQRGFEKLGRNLPAGQGVDENMEQTEKWENRSGCKHKGIYSLSAVTCVAPGRYGLHVPDWIGGD